ncbi:MAG: sugar ABC transporter permease [Gemmatimonadetes bacterium]|nr:sugar ABC transporter permease [Gemmatimonadota bacterium]
MTQERRAVRWGTILAALWLLGVLAIVYRVGAAAENALALEEARSVASSFDANQRPARTAMRYVPVAGPIVTVVRTMKRQLGPAAERLRTEERVLIWQTWRQRFISLPVKDADAWDIVGAVVVAANPVDMPWIVWVVTVGAGLLALGLLRRGMRLAATDRETAPYYLVADGVAVLAIGTAVVAILVRGYLQEVAMRLPPPTAITRFDPMVLQLPNGRLVALVVAGVWAAVAAGILGTAWLASPSQALSARRTARTAWGFLAPSGVHLLLFTLGPLAFTAWLSLYRWDLLATDRPFIGLANYRELLRDPQFWNALKNTALYALYVPVTMGLALGAAVLLNQPLRGIRVLRAMVFLPAIVSYVAIAMVWQWIYHADYGLLNHVLQRLGGTGHDWLGDPSTALPALMVVSVWVQLGYQMVVYLAGLQGVPATLLEAARLDGAGSWTRFWRITVPLLRPVSLYLLVTGIIWSFQVFALVYVMTEGGPARSTDVLVYQIYQNAWEFRRMGYASALSWVLFALLIGLTVLQWRLLNRRVEHAA